MTPPAAWTWVSGSKLIKPSGVYGTKGAAASSNVPGARSSATSWISSSDTLWLFGGFGIDSAGTTGQLNDLWAFDGTNWTWVSGSNLVNQKGTYGTKGTSAAANTPGARAYPISWTDSSGNLWLFGGKGFDSAGVFDDLNDLWKFDGAVWTWISGSNLIDQTGTYGTKGTAAAANVPGARAASISWVDASGHFWLFGGYGWDSAGNLGFLNDLWMFDGAQWTWVSGPNLVNQLPVYGVQGGPSFNNIPGSRLSPVALGPDAEGNLWLFGGSGYDSAGVAGNLNDLWKFDGVNWTWVSGSKLSGQAGTYGTRGQPAATNCPGGRYGPNSWTDSEGNFWVFGGAGFDSSGTLSYLNDLWKFDGVNWSWVSGSLAGFEAGLYGSKGVPAPGNVAGSRNYSASWIDRAGTLWLLGGTGFDSAGAGPNLMNDLWSYSPR